MFLAVFCRSFNIYAAAHHVLPTQHVIVPTPVMRHVCCITNMPCPFSFILFYLRCMDVCIRTSGAARTIFLISRLFYFSLDVHTDNRRYLSVVPYI